MAYIQHFKIGDAVYDVRRIYEELGLSKERFVELLDRDFYVPDLASAPTSTTLTYEESDGTVCPFRIGQFCRVADDSSPSGYRVYICMDKSDTAASWAIIPDAAIEYEVEELIKDRLADSGMESIPMMNGQPAILFGNGAPQASVVPDNWIGLFDGGFEWIGKPVCIGQQYIDTSVSSGGRYIGVRNGIWDMKWLNS